MFDTDKFAPYQKAASRRALAWTEAEAQRLGVTPDDILRAVRLGWLAPEIEALPCVSARKIAGGPPYRVPEGWNP